MGTLFIVSTPIGNLEDITIRALKVLFSVNGIACEDTRKTGQLMKLLRTKYASFFPGEVLDSSEQRLVSYYEQNEFKRIPDILTALKNDLNIALVSDAGTPSVSDPGFRLVQACLAENVPIQVIPGASSVLTALVASGLPTDKFLFLGYPPHKGGKRLQLYEHLKKSQESVNSTVILFEAPHKLVKTLEEIQSVFGDIEIVIARELTKIHEEITSKAISEYLQQYKKQPPKGELVILFHLDV